MADNRYLLSDLRDFLRQLLPVISIGTPDGSIEVSLGEKPRTRVRDEDLIARLNKLEAIQTAMREAAEDIGVLREETRTRLNEIQDLKITMAQMEKDRDGVETMLSIKKETFEGLMGAVQRKSEKRTIIIGLFIGFLTGCGSSYVIWLLTN